MSTFAPRRSDRRRRAGGTDEWSGLERLKALGLHVFVLLVSVFTGYVLLLAPAVVRQLVLPDNLAPTVVTVVPRGSPTLGPADVNALTQALPGVMLSRALLPATQLATDTSPAIDVQSVDPSFFSLYGVQAISGRMFTATDDRDAKAVAVLGQQAARTLFGDPTLAIGQSLRLRNMSFAVVGVLADSDVSQPAGLSHEVFVPLQTGRARLFGPQTPTEVLVGVSNASEVPAIVATATRVLAARYPTAPLAFSVQTQVTRPAPESPTAIITRAAVSTRTEFLEAKGIGR